MQTVITLLWMCCKIIKLNEQAQLPDVLLPYNVILKGYRWHVDHPRTVIGHLVLGGPLKPAQVCFGAADLEARGTEEKSSPR